jgi:hypothetical protein
MLAGVAGNQIGMGMAPNQEKPCIAYLLHSLNRMQAIQKIIIRKNIFPRIPGGANKTTGNFDSGDYFFDPEVMVMTLCTGICAGMVMVILRVLTTQELMPLLFVTVAAFMVLVEGSWLNFWYKPMRRVNRVIIPS